MNITETVYSCKRFSVCGSCNLLCSREIVDIHEKENALDIVTEDRVYHIVAESPEDARYKGHFVGLVRLVQIWPCCSWGSLGNAIPAEKKRWSPKSHLLGSATPTLEAPCCSYWGGGSDYQSLTGLSPSACGYEHAVFKGYFRRHTKP